MTTPLTNCAGISLTAGASLLIEQPDARWVRVVLLDVYTFGADVGLTPNPTAPPNSIVKFRVTQGEGLPPQGGALVNAQQGQARYLALLVRDPAWRL